MGLEKSIIDAIDNTNLRMTDLGFSVSQMVHDAVVEDHDDCDDRDDHDDHDDHDDPLDRDHDDDEQYLETALQMGRRRRTGVRGRPKGIDYGFGKSTTHKMAPEAARLMGAANVAFVSRDHERAIAVLMQVIQLAPNSFEPYHTLGLVHEECGDRDKAAGFYMLAALINPGYVELWQKLADWAQEDDRPGKREEAIFCLGKVISAWDALEGGNLAAIEDNYWRRARLYLANNEPREAVKSFLKLLTHKLDDIALVKRVAKLAISQEIPFVAADVLERAAKKNTEKLTWSYLNLLLELLIMSGTADDDKRIVSLVKEYCGLLVDQHLLLSNPEWGVWSETERHCWLLSQVPVEIYLKFAVALVRQPPDPVDHADHVDKVDHVDIPEKVDMARITRCDPEAHGDLLSLLAETFYTHQAYSQAYDCLSLLQSCESTWSVKSCCLQGHCLVKMGRPKEALEPYQTCLLADPGYEEARVALAECFKALGDDRSLWETLEMGRRFKHRSGTGATRKKRAVPVEEEIWTGSDASDASEASDIDSDGDIPSVQEGSLLLSKIKSKTQHKKRQPARQARQVRHEYTQEECQSCRQEYTKILLSLEVGVSRRELYSDALLAAHQLIQEGLLNNPNIMVTSNKRCKWLLSVLGESDVAVYLGGLTLHEWCVLLVKYVAVMTDVFSQGKQACLLLSRLHDHSMFFKALPHNDCDHVTLRVAMAECAMKAREYPILLTAIRPFIKSDSGNATFLKWLNGGLLRAGQEGRDCWLSSTPFARFLHRHCCKSNMDPTWLLLQGHLYGMMGSWEEALRTYLLIQNVGASVVQMCLFSAYYHRAQQRTCRTQRWYLVRALACLDSVGGDQGTVDPGTVLYNKGRCLHGLGVMDGAVRYYQAAIDIHVNEGGSTDNGIRHAAEYNLRLILAQKIV